MWNGAAKDFYLGLEKGKGRDRRRFNRATKLLLGEYNDFVYN